MIADLAHRIDLLIPIAEQKIPSNTPVSVFLSQSNSFIEQVLSIKNSCVQPSWLCGTDGHIRAEYLDEGKGFRQVDAAAAGKLDCCIYHIPYFTSENVEMPVLYLSIPNIEIVETK